MKPNVSLVVLIRDQNNYKAMNIKQQKETQAINKK